MPQTPLPSPKDDAPPTVDILIFGGTGYVGASLARHWHHRGLRVAVVLHHRAPSPGTLPEDIPLVPGGMETTDAALACLRRQPSLRVVNAAGEKNLGLCEREPDRARAINALGAEALAKACRITETPLVHLSTDLVFPALEGGYRPEDPPAPRTVYGHTKLEGERLVREACPEALVLRAAGVHGAQSPLLAWLRGELAAGRRVEAYTDVINSPTYAPNLGELISAAWDGGLTGLTLHACGPEAVSRYALFQTAVDVLGWSALPGRLDPVTGGEKRDRMLLQPNASLDVSLTRALLPDLPLDGPRRGLERLRDSLERNAA